MLMTNRCREPSSVRRSATLHAELASLTPRTTVPETMFRTIIARDELESEVRASKIVVFWESHRAGVLASICISGDSHAWSCPGTDAEGGNGAQAEHSHEKEKLDELHDGEREGCWLTRYEEQERKIGNGMILLSK